MRKTRKPIARRERRLNPRTVSIPNSCAWGYLRGYFWRLAVQGIDSYGDVVAAASTKNRKGPNRALSILERLLVGSAPRKPKQRFAKAATRPQAIFSVVLRQLRVGVGTWEERAAINIVTSDSPAYRIGEWTLIPRDRRLVCNATESLLSPRSTDVLVYLVERVGRTVTHQELLAEYWRGAISSTNAVHKSIAELRHAFALAGDETTYIETIPRRGYRLIAPVGRIGTPLSTNGVGATDSRSATENGTPVSTAAGSIAQSCENQPRWRRPSVVLAGLALVAALGWWAMHGLRPEAVVIRMNGHSAVLLPERDTLSDAGTSLADAIFRRAAAQLGNQAGAEHQRRAGRLRWPGAAIDARSWDVDYAVGVGVSQRGDELVVLVEISPAAPEQVPQFARIAFADGSAADLVDQVAGRITDDLRILFDDAALAEMREWGTGSVLAYRLAREGDSYRRFATVDSQAQAAMLFLRSIEVDPDFEYGYVSLFSVYALLEEITRDPQGVEEARRNLQSLIHRASARPIDPELLERMSSQYEVLSASTPLEAEAHWRQALASNPEDANAYRRYAYLLYGAKLIRESIAYFDRAIAILEKHSFHQATTAFTNLRITQTSFLNGDRESRIAAIKRNVDLDGFRDNPQGLYGLVHDLAAVRRFSEAEQYLARLNGADPVWGRAAELNLRTLRGDLSLGSSELEAVLADGSISHAQRGIVCFQLGDVPCGIEHWRRMEPAYRRMMWRFIGQEETYFASGVVGDPRYQGLLDELSIGRKWRAYMREQAARLAAVTGIPVTSDLPAEDRPP